MKRLEREKSGELFDRFWNEMKSEWFKLEVLQDYTAEDDGPSLQAWLKGDRQKALELIKVDPEPDFTQKCRQSVESGVKMLRIHVLERPLTPYMAWELEFYRQISIPLRREQVFLINKAECADLELPSGDFMIFDQQRAVLNEYQSGRMTHQNFYDQSDNLEPFLALRAALISRAKPLNS